MSVLQSRFLELLGCVERLGMDHLSAYLVDETDFFTAPASTYHHGSKECGLVEHSLAVYDNLVTIMNAFFEKFDSQSLIICGLLHDVCKTNFYQKGYRNKKNEQTGRWEKVEVYEIHDQLPLGHGEKSVMILQRYIPLSEDEMMAIRWHMAGFDDATRGYGGMQTLSAAMKRYPLITALHMADMATTYFNGV